MMNWRFPMFGVLIGTLVAWLLFPSATSIVQGWLPVEHWFEVRSIHVGNTTAGRMPRVRVDRRIHEPFTADWIVTLRRRDGEGFAVFCSRAGRNDYRPVASLPEFTDLDWWMEIPPNDHCPNLITGFYVVTIAWDIEIAGLPPRTVRVESNIFEVTE